MLSEPETNMAVAMTENGLEYQELPNAKFLDEGNDGVPPRPYILDRGALHAYVMMICS